MTPATPRARRTSYPALSLGAEEFRFNKPVIMDIIYIASRPVLHMVEDETKFSAAAFLRNRFLVDQGSQLGKSHPFAEIVEIHNVELQATGTEAHSSLGLGERYHQPLHNTYRKLTMDYPKEDADLLLQFAVKGMNYTLGSEGIVPSVLVFGEYPPAFTTSELEPSRSPAHLRASIANDARIEMSKHMGKAPVARVLKHAVKRRSPPKTWRPGTGLTS